MSQHEPQQGPGTEPAKWNASIIHRAVFFTPVFHAVTRQCVLNEKGRYKQET